METEIMFSQLKIKLSFILLEQEVFLYKTDIIALHEKEQFKYFNKNIPAMYSHQAMKITKKVYLLLQAGIDFLAQDYQQFLHWSISPFAKNILIQLPSIVKKGSIISYKKLAISLGLGSSYTRAVSNVMARNPFPIIFPCHRVIYSQQQKSKKFGVSAGVLAKEWLLHYEGH